MHKGSAGHAIHQSGSMCSLCIGWVSVTSRTCLFMNMEMVKISTVKLAMTHGGPRRNRRNAGEDAAPCGITQQDSTSWNSKLLQQDDVFLTRNVGQCPTWWSPCWIQVAPSVQRCKVSLTPTTRCRAVTLPRCKISWNLQECPKLVNRSQPLAGRSSPYCEDMWRRYCCLTSFFSDCRYLP